MRQGAKMSPGREELAVRARRAQELDTKAKARGLKGDRRYRFIADGLGMRVSDDFRQVRFLLKDRKTYSVESSNQKNSTQRRKDAKTPKFGI